VSATANSDGARVVKLAEEVAKLTNYVAQHDCEIKKLKEENKKLKEQIRERDNLIIRLDEQFEERGTVRPIHGIRKFNRRDPWWQLSDVVRETGLKKSTIEFWANKDENSVNWFNRRGRPRPTLVNVEFLTAASAPEDGSDDSREGKAHRDWRKKLKRELDKARVRLDAPPTSEGEGSSYSKKAGPTRA
jgi:hypothetical protein